MSSVRGAFGRPTPSSRRPAGAGRRGTGAWFAKWLRGSDDLRRVCGPGALSVSCRSRSPRVTSPPASEGCWPAGLSCSSPERVPPLAGRHPRLPVVPLAGAIGGGAFGSKALLHRRVRNVPGPFPALEYPILPWAWFPSKVPSRSFEPSSGLSGSPSRAGLCRLRRVRIPPRLRSSDLGVVPVPKRRGPSLESVRSGGCASCQTLP